MQKVKPFLWFDTQAEEAANFYTSLIPNSKVTEVAPGPNGRALTVAFELDSQEFVALNGGPTYALTEAFSILISCKDQAEVDDLWDKLTAGGGEESRCGWLKDKFGLSWQVIPEGMVQLLADADPGRAQRATQAMLQMTKIDLAAMQTAAAG